MTAQLVARRFPVADSWRFQLFLVVGDRWIEVGVHQNTPADIDALVAYVRRVLPGVPVSWD